jgi:hypothetical protein
MLRKKIMIAAVFTVISALCFLANAKIGLGIQWGNDFSLSMDDKLGEPLVLTQLKLKDPLIGYSGTIDGVSLPIYVNRTGWERKMFNIGAKLFIDIIPFFDAIELSANYGIWEYNGSITYPTAMTYIGNGKSVTANDFKVSDSATMPITLDQFGLGYLGLKNTPYMKLNFDLTIRKYLVQFPKHLKTLRLYAGGGASLIFATPVLSSKLVEDALGDQLNTTRTLSSLSGDLLGNQKIMDAVVKEITSQLMTPHWGCHLDLGVMIKIPIIPIGVYVDGKLMIPFKDLDASVNVGGFGFLVNSGIALYF